MDEQMLTRLLKELAVEDRAAWAQTRPTPGPAPWHPTWAQLIWYALSLLPGALAELVGGHLKREACPRCRERARSLEARRDSIASLCHGLTLSDPEVAYARVGGSLDEPIVSPDKKLQGKLFETHGQLVLKVRTTKAEWQGRLMGYALQGHEGAAELTGFLVLRPDERDWYAARVTWDESEIVRRLGGQIRGILCGVVDEEKLTEHERETLLACVEQSQTEAAARSAWRDWAANGLARVAPEAEEVRRLYQAVSDRLRV